MRFVLLLALIFLTSCHASLQQPSPQPTPSVLSEAWNDKEASTPSHEPPRRTPTTNRNAESMAARFPMREGVPDDLDLVGRWRGSPAMYTYNIYRDAEGYRGIFQQGGCLYYPTFTFTAIRRGDRVIFNFGGGEMELQLVTFEDEVVLIYPFALDQIHDGTLIDPRIAKDWQHHPMILRHSPANSASTTPKKTAG